MQTFLFLLPVIVPVKT